MAKKVNYAKLSPINKALLSEEYGLSYAIKLFGQEAVDSIPVFQKGKNAGKKKGVLHWVNAEVGGWTREWGVVTPGLARAWIAEYSGAYESSAMRGTWFGRVQNLAGSKSVLGEEARAQHAREQAKFAADLEEDKAQYAAERAAKLAEEDSLVGLDNAALNAMADAHEYRRDLF